MKTFANQGFTNTGKIISKKLFKGVPDLSLKTVTGLLGYNVYRDNTLITPLPLESTTLLDPSLEFGVYEYAVTAVYDEGESGPISTSAQIGNPEMVISPEEITETVIIGNYYEKIITIYNEGNTDLLWTAINNDFWTFVSPPSGIIEPNSGIDIQLFINTFNLIAGEYSTEITFTQNNINNPTIALPVHITAIGAPGISVLPGELNFGDVVYGFDYTASLTIQNIGTETLELSEIVTSNPIISIGEYPLSILPYEHIQVEITLDASILGELVGNVSITSNDAINPQIDIPLMANVYLQPPVFLQSEVIGNDVNLNWEMAIGGSGEWIHWDTGENFTSIGLTGGGSFQYAARWEPTQLIPFSGKIVPKVAFFPSGENSAFTLKIWQGENASTPVISQPINNYSANQWNEIFIQNAFAIDASDELWIGIEVNHPDGDFPAGADMGPAMAGFGDMINLEGYWESVSAVYGIDFNWNIQFYVLSEDSSYQVVNTPVLKETPKKFFNQGQLVSNKKVNQSQHALFAPKESNEEILGYNVYRDGSILNDFPFEETNFLDQNVPFGIYNYGVTAVYDLGESPQTSINVQVGAPNLVFNPELISDSLESGEITEHIVTLYNGGDFNLEWNAISNASWISISEFSGTIEPGNTAELIVSLSSAGLFNGNYQSNIVFEINNINNPISYLPVNINVSGEALLMITPDTLDFGTTALGSAKTAYIKVTNPGNDFIFISEMQTTPYVFTGQNFPVYLYPGGEMFLGIQFTPDSLGTFTGSFKVFTDDPDIPSAESILIGSSLLPQPLNLTASLDSNNVLLDWQNPFGGSENHLQYCDDQSVTSIGYSDGGTFMVAAKFGPEELLTYNGLELSQIGFVPWTDNANFTLKVWIGESAENLVLSQPVIELNPFEWNDVVLDFSIPVDTSAYLWIGYEVTHEPGDFPAGCDFGPAVIGKGDMISTDGISWLSLNYYGLSYNWSLRGYVGTDKKLNTLAPSAKLDERSFFNNGVLKSAFEPQQSSLKFAPKSLVLLGYNVYRNGLLLNENILLTTSDYTDPDLNPGLYSYQVSAVYETGESLPTEAIEVLIEEPVLFPAGWNHHHTGMTHIVHIPTNAQGNLNFMSAGDWIGVFYNDNGELKSGGSVMWSETDSLKLIVYGDDPSTSLKEGFDLGEWLLWKVYMNETQEEHNIGVEYNQMMPQHNGLFTMLGNSALTAMQLSITNIQDLDTDEISIFPNPATNQFSISGLEKVDEITIVNAFGEVVKKIEANGNNKRLINLDVPAGIYFIILQNAQTSVNKKLIIN
ncbi:MAG: choice-of-anchor D domain-containing protein [Bacteroidales bacterium]